MNICLNKNFLKKEDLPGYTEIFLLIPFLNKDIYYKELISILGPHNEGLFTKLFYTGKHLLQDVDVSKCDFSVIPFKYDFNRSIEICLNAKKYNKKVIGFYNDDNINKLEIDLDTILFRTSLLKSEQTVNERVFPALIPDHFNANYVCDKDGISFCGCLTQLRYEIIEQIKQLHLKTDFIFRSGFWAPEIDCKIKARHEYNTNLLANRYALCIRGVGNFSYRFYEALSFGRIPILIDTDIALPFANIIDWNKHIIFIKEKDIKNLPKLLKEDNRCMIKNRKMWEEYFSVEGYTRSFAKDI